MNRHQQEGTQEEDESALKMVPDYRICLLTSYDKLAVGGTWPFGCKRKKNLGVVVGDTFGRLVAQETDANLDMKIMVSIA